MKLQVDRSGIDNRYAVLPAMPLPTATETLEWVTNIFIGSDLSETRTALALYPAITINYTFEVGLGNRDWLATLITEANAPSTSPRNEWVLPYFPHAMSATVTAGRLASRPFTDPVNQLPRTSYPLADYYLKFDRHRFIYDRTPVTASPFMTGDEVWLVPCFLAYIDPSISLTDLGKCRFGHKVELSFRMTGEAERQLTYHVDNFNFLDALQSPLKIKVTRHQADFDPLPAIPNTYTPVAYRANQQAMTDVEYWLEYDPSIRQEYALRGYFMQHQGSLTAGNYVEETKLHRLADDRLTITYGQGVSIAKARMREVSA